MSAEINHFEIDSNGNVKVRRRTGNSTVQHEYWAVPKFIIMKLLNSKNPPTVTDFDKWITDEKNKEKKDNGLSCSYGWWCNE